MPDSGNDADKWTNVGDDLAWVGDSSVPDVVGNNNDSAMALAQGLAAGAALLAAFSF